MAASCRFAFAVHVLAVLAYKEKTDVSSVSLAASVNTNPVIIRRLLQSLRRSGLIVTQRGAGGGARLARPASEITLGEIYGAVAESPAFSHHPHQPNQRCPVGRGIELVLTEVFQSAQSALEEALARRTLAEVLVTMVEAPRATDGPVSGVRSQSRSRIRRRPDSLSAANP